MPVAWITRFPIAVKVCSNTLFIIHSQHSIINLSRHEHVHALPIKTVFLPAPEINIPARVCIDALPISVLGSKLPDVLASVRVVNLAVVKQCPDFPDEIFLFIMVQFFNGLFFLGVHVNNFYSIVKRILLNLRIKWIVILSKLGIIFSRKIIKSIQLNQGNHSFIFRLFLYFSLCSARIFDLISVFLFSSISFFLFKISGVMLNKNMMSL